MREFYFYGLDYEKDESERYEERPFILGLTASPIKSKIKQSSISSFKLEMMDEIKDLCANLNSKIVSVDINQIDQNVLAKHTNNYITYNARDYWKKLDFIKDPWSRIPNISDILQKYESKYEKEEYQKIQESLEIFEEEVKSALKNQRVQIEK